MERQRKPTRSPAREITRGLKEATKFNRSAVTLQLALAVMDPGARREFRVWAKGKRLTTTKIIAKLKAMAIARVLNA